MWWKKRMLLDDLDEMLKSEVPPPPQKKAPDEKKFVNPKNKAWSFSKNSEGSFSNEQLACILLQEIRDDIEKKLEANNEKMDALLAYLKTVFGEPRKD